MTWTVSSSGTQTATGAEDVLVAADTNNATFVFLPDLTNMVNGDVTEFRLYTKVLSTGTLHLVWKGTFANVPLIVVPQSPFVPSDQSIKVTLKQIAGTNRAYDWKLLRQ